MHRGYRGAARRFGRMPSTWPPERTHLFIADHYADPLAPSLITRAALDPDSAGAYVIGGLRHGIAQQLTSIPRTCQLQAIDRLWHLTASTLGIA